MSVYPNPAENMIWVDAESIPGFRNGAVLRIFDAIGRSVITSEYEFHQQFDVSGLSDGVYLVVVEKDGKRATRKFVKQ